MQAKLLLTLAYVFAGISIFTGGAQAASLHSRKVCATNPQVGFARCHAIILTDDGGIAPQAAGSPHGFGPANFKAAYGVRSSASTRVAVVVAYDAPAIVNDLAVFSKSFGLPNLPSCTSAAQNSCFQKLSQRGGTDFPATNSSWAVEASLDVESIHGMCQSCRINLVEANSSSMADLAAAVDTAVASGAKVISNSYGGSEVRSQMTYDGHFHKSGVAMVVSSGDSGYGVNYPAASPYVVAVGGTSLRMSGARVTNETAWSGAGSGCSVLEAKPIWQHDKKCLNRSVSDVSADADPASGAAIYDSYATNGRSGWFTVGGTSLASPLIAGIIAASGNLTNEPAAIYGSQSSIRDIVGGYNGTCSSYFCRAVPGYDGPTGLGVLNHL